MTEVFFDGRGEWFTRDGDSLKLAITRKTKDPYRDCNELELNEDYFPGYDEWLNGQEDTNEKFVEWVELDQASKNKSSHYNYQSKDHQYDYKLEGIFVRDPNVKGDVYDTDGLRSFGANYVSCPDVKGVFKLTDSDEEAYQLTSNWKVVKKGIKKLSPSTHASSYFLKMVSEGKLSIKDMEKCYFEIQYKHYFDFFGKSKPIKNKPTLTLLGSEPLVNKEPEKEKEKLEVSMERSLKDFVTWLEKETKKVEGLDFSKKKLDCKKEHLLSALKYWEKKYYKSSECIWKNVPSFGNGTAKIFWYSDQRKNICAISDDWRGYQNPERRNIFKKIGIDMFV